MARTQTTTRTRLVAGAAATLMIGGGLIFAAPASAQCIGQNFTFAGHGGGRCDSPPGPDGSFTRCDTVTVFGISSTNCYQVPPGTP